MKAKNNSSHDKYKSVIVLAHYAALALKRILIWRRKKKEESEKNRDSRN